MNGESQVLVTESVIFPMPESVAAENEVLDENKLLVENIIEITAIETKDDQKDVRFARLKKSLRKRSASIL